MARLVQFFGLGATRPTRDDEVLPVTRWLGRLLVPVLTVAFLILFGLPDQTTELFAWTIRPDMTPIVMGAGYGTGAYFFYRVATTERWHRVTLVFPGIAVFTWFMAFATALHWENFNHEHVTFAIWVFLYVAAPILVPAIWLLNRRTDPLTVGDSTLHLPRPILWMSGVSGVAIAATSAVLFVTPGVLITYWPWTVSPLTSRILLGWFALFGVANLAVAFDGRWSAARIVVETKAIGFGLILLGVARTWGDFDVVNPMTWAFVGGFASYLVAILAVYYYMETQ